MSPLVIKKALAHVMATTTEEELELSASPKGTCRSYGLSQCSLCELLLIAQLCLPILPLAVQHGMKLAPGQSYHLHWAQDSLHKLSLHEQCSCSFV